MTLLGLRRGRQRRSRFLATCVLCIHASLSVVSTVGVDRGQAGVWDQMYQQLLRREDPKTIDVGVGTARKPKVVFALFTSQLTAYRRKLEAIMDTWGQALISEGRFVAVGGRTYPRKYLQPGTVLAVDCGDDADGLSCKEAALMQEGANRSADWLFITGEDNYLDTNTVEKFLEKQDPGKVIGFGCLGCGKGSIPSGMHCLGVNQSGGMCGGCGYAISRAALSELTRNGLEALIQEYGGHQAQTLANDMQTSCSLRNRGAALQLLDFPTEGNPIFGVTDYEERLKKTGEGTVGVFHYVQPDVMRWMHGFKQQLPEEDMLLLEAKAFDRGCARGMNSSDTTWQHNYDECLKRHRDRVLPWQKAEQWLNEHRKD